MAEKKPARPDPGKDGGKSKGAMSLAQNAIAFIVAGLIAGGVGAVQGMQVRAPTEVPTPGAATSAGAAEVEKTFAPLVDMGMIELPPVVTNLAAPPDVWVRVEGAILFEGKTLPHGEALAGQIAGDILAFMRTQTLQQIQGVAGLQHLRQDLNERVSTRSDGQVREFVIKSLVVQ